MILARIDHCTSLKQGAPWLATQIYKEKGKSVVWRECRPQTTYTDSDNCNPWPQKVKRYKIKNVKKIVREIGWIASLNPTFTNPLKASTSCCRKMTLHFPLLSYCTTTSGPCTWPLKNDTYVTFLVCIIILNNYSWFCQSIICYLLKLLNHITFMACLEV